MASNAWDVRTLSLDLLESILDAYYKYEIAWDEVGQWYPVSVCVVKKLLQQFRRIRGISPKSVVPVADR